MKQADALAMFLFDTYSEMAEEDQSVALAALKTADPAVHDALVQLLVTDALRHILDERPWLNEPVAVSPAIDGALAEDQVIPGTKRR